MASLDDPQSPAPRPKAKASKPAMGAPTRDDCRTLGATFARAFVDDPVWMYLCANNARRYNRWAPSFFASETGHHLSFDNGVIATGDHKGGALWAPPNKWKSTLRDAARVAPAAVGLFGKNVVAGMRVMNELEKLHPSEPHWYLALLGTDPDFQGRGYGSAAVEPVLATCDAQHLGSYLESSKEKNVPFYEHHGYSVIRRISLDRGKGPSMWLMWRDPR